MSRIKLPVLVSRRRYGGISIVFRRRQRLVAEGGCRLPPGYKQVELALVKVENATGFNKLLKSIFSPGLLFSSIATPSIAMEFDQ